MKRFLLTKLLLLDLHLMISKTNFTFAIRLMLSQNTIYLENKIGSITNCKLLTLRHSVNTCQHNLMMTVTGTEAKMAHLFLLWNSLLSTRNLVHSNGNKVYSGWRTEILMHSKQAERCEHERKYKHPKASKSCNIRRWQCVFTHKTKEIF